MAKIKILSGDFLDGHATYEPGFITIETSVYPWPGLKISTQEIRDLTLVSESSYRDVSGSVSLGLAGAMVLGPIGAVAGLMLAGEKDEVTFSLALRDGRSMLCATDGCTYRNIESTVGKQAYFKQNKSHQV
ncbi:hypothetical protein [Pseudomonas sp. A-B-19]|uniref:hypothetical protein n=1 Tax=Pseudomonas sp. A-B-19 TaxID=2832405 RepID=UPI001CBC2960|nr:hypothetical protein [Pseudomonas sp. A-B-19]